MRELLQNSRDADATNVEIVIDTTSDGCARIAFRDDGLGMSFDHARSYLFTLYASSKRAGRDAGRFGVGFWSVLRFAPERILVRSWPVRGAPWEVELDGSLRRALRRSPQSQMARGTEIVLERRMDAVELERAVARAASTSARFLTQRRHTRRALTIRLNGRCLNEPFTLRPPSLAFADARRRGVVALGRVPLVELFAHGLLVRSAPIIDDLMSRASADKSENRWSQHASEGAAPQAILESSRLELQLARGDVRDERELRRLIRKAQVAVRRLVSRQIDHVRPRSFKRRALDALGQWAGGIEIKLLLSSVALSLTVVAAAWWWASTAMPRRDEAPVLSVASGSGETSDPRIASYRDLGGMYDGPDVSKSSSAAQIVALRYRPIEADLYITALAMDDPETPPGALRESDLIGPYRGAACQVDCIEIKLIAEGRPGPMRLPFPTERRVDAASVVMNGRPVSLRASRQDEPVVVLPESVASSATLVYRAGPAQDGPPMTIGSPPQRTELAAIAAQLKALPADQRIDAASQWVLERVRYSDASSAAALQARSLTNRVSFIGRALEIGAGDCDVQNGILVALLQDADVSSRLVVGFLGRSGAAFGLHAWAEYRLDGEPWRVLDLTSREAQRTAPNAGLTQVHPNVAGSPAAKNVSRLLARKPTTRSLWLLIFSVVVGVAALFMSLRLAWRGTTRSMRLDRRFGLTPLLRGALERPEAFRDAPEVFWRPLVPLFPRGAVALGEAWSLATRGRLYSAQRRSTLAQYAVRSGSCVLDATAEEGALLAAALGAASLDEWDEALSRSRSSPLLDAASRALSRRDERWRLSAADVPLNDGDGNACPAAAALALFSRSWRGESVVRRLILDARAPWLLACERRYSTHPAEAIFDLADRVLESVGCPDSYRAELLAPLARAALQEAAA